MAKQGAEARPLETGPEQQSQKATNAPKSAEVSKAEIAKAVEPLGILTNAAPEQMLAAPAGLETLPALEPSKWEQVKGWTNSVVGKMREAFKKPVPPTLDQLHDQQVQYINNFLDNAKLSDADRTRLEAVIKAQVDATERNPVVIAEKMKTALLDHNARMKQMDVIAKKMQGALETGKSEELGKEMMKLDPETSAAISRTYEKLKALKPDMRTPDKSAQTQWDLLNNPSSLANFLRQDIPNGESLTNQQILSLAKTLSSALQKEDLDKKHSAAEEKAEKEKQDQARIDKMKKVAYFANKYSDVQPPEDDKVDEFLANMATREQSENMNRLSQEALDKTNKARSEQISKLIETGRRSMNIEKLIDEASMAAASNNFDKGILMLRSSLASASDMIDRELVTVSKSGELNMNANPTEFVRRVDILLDSALAKNGLLLSELDRGRIRDLVKSSVVSKYNEKLAQLAKTTPESQLGKKQVMEHLEGVGASLEKTKTDRLQSIEALIGQNLTKDQEKILEERRQEIELQLSLDKDFATLQKKGWADIGPDGKRRMTAAGLIAMSTPHWGKMSPEQKNKIEALQNETLEINKKIQANNERLTKIQDAYEKKQDQVVDDLQKARDGLLTKYKGEVIEEDAQKHFLDLVKANLAENKMPDIYEELAKHLTDDIREHNADLTDLVEEKKPTPPPVPESVRKKSPQEIAAEKEKTALEDFAKSESTGLAEAAQILKEKGKDIESMSIGQADSYLKELLAQGKIVDTNSADVKGILEDIKIGLAATPATAEAIKAKVLAAIAEHNKKIESQPPVPAAEALKGENPTIPGPQKTPEKEAESKATQEPEPLPAESTGVRAKTPEAAPEYTDAKIIAESLDKINQAKWSGLIEIADLMDRAGKGDIGKKLRDEDMEMYELFDDAKRNEDMIEVENIAEPGFSNRFSETLTAIKDSLRVYPPIAAAVEKKFMKLAKEHNQKTDAGEPPMAQAA